MHNKFFTDHKLLTVELSNIMEYIIETTKADPLEKKFCSKINIFLNRYPISLENNSKDVTLLLYNYWHVLYRYRKHSTWQQSTMKLYINASIRLVEFLIFASHIGNKKISTLFFSMKEPKLIFLHFQEIENQIDDKTFMIAEDKHNEIIVMGTNEYKSALTTQPRGEKSKSYLSFYFKLGHDQVSKIYHMFESKNIINGRNPHGGNWKRTPFISKESYLSSLLPDGEEDQGKENNLEFKNRKNKITAFDLLENNLLPEETNPFTDLSKLKMESLYKRFLVNKAIGQSIARQNLSLKARYNIPDIEILVSLFRDMIRETSLSVNFILLTTIFGIRSEKLIYAVAGVDTHIKYLTLRTL